jgi:hypothetical protein
LTWAEHITTKARLLTANRPEPLISNLQCCFPQKDCASAISLQDIDEAVLELRRAVHQLGMAGAMLPSRGLPLDLGHKTYWPLYAEAENGPSVSIESKPM